MRTTSHAANVENSPRLQRVLAVLNDCQEHTTYEILHQAQVCAVNSIIHELRRNGYAIPKAKRHNGRFHYQLVRKSPLEGGFRGMSPASTERTAS